MIPKISHNDSSVDGSGTLLIDDRYPLGYIVALCLLIVLIFLVNFVVIYLFLTRDSLRTDTNRILISLAVSDMINGVITIPLQIGCDHFTSERSLRLASMVLYRFVAASTMLHILAVTLERHICVVFPLRYNSLVTRRRTILGLSVVWLTSILYAVIGLSWLGLPQDFDHLDHPPGLSDSKIMQIEFAYAIMGFFLCFLVPLVIMSYSFTKILCEISRHNSRTSELMLGVNPERTRLRMDRKPVLIFMAMLLLFVLSWSTWYAQLFILSVSPRHYELFNGTAMLFDYLRSTTSLINPLLYALLKKDFREVLKKVIVHAKARAQGALVTTNNNESLTLKSLTTADTAGV